MMGSSPADELKSLKRAVIKAKNNLKIPPLTKEDNENNISILLNVLSLAEKLERAFPQSDMAKVLLNRAMLTLENELSHV